MSVKSVKKLNSNQLLYTFTEAAQKANIQNLTTFTSRWWPKILDAHSGLDCDPLRVQDGETSGGNPRWRITEAGIQAAIEYRQLIESEPGSSQSKYARYCELIRDRYPIQSDTDTDKSGETTETDVVPVEIVTYQSDRHVNGSLSVYEEFIAEVSEEIASDYGATLEEISLQALQDHESFQAERKAAVLRGLQKGTELFQLEQAAKNSRVRDLTTRAAKAAVGKSQES